MSDTYEQLLTRFDRIEDKLDQLSEAMVSLARNEERILAVQEQLGQMQQRLNRHSEKIDDLERESNSNTFTSKIVWAVLITLVTAVTSMVLGLM